MSDTFILTLVTPERQFISALVSRVRVAGAEGDFEVLPRHAPFMSVLRSGIIELDAVVERGSLSDMRVESYYVRGGFADVTSEGLTVLAEHAHLLSDMKGDVLDAERVYAREALESAATSQETVIATDLLTLLDGLS